MQQVTANEVNGLPMPPGVTPITDLKNQKRASKTLSKAVGLHLEGKLESAARLLTKAIDDGERDLGLFAALGHIQYEMRDYEAAAKTYAQLAEADPKHRTAHFNAGVCFGNLRQWGEAAESFQRASIADATRSNVGGFRSLVRPGFALRSAFHATSVRTSIPTVSKGLSAMSAMMDWAFPRSRSACRR